MYNFYWINLSLVDVTVPWWQREVVFALDWLWVLFLALNMIKIGVLAVAIVLGAIFLNTTLFRQVERACSIANGLSGKMYHHQWFQRIVWLIPRNHLQITYYILLGSAAFSSLFTIFIMSNVPMNVYTLSYVFFNARKHPFEVIVLSIVLVGQFVCGTLCMVPLAFLNDAAHSSGKYAVPLQAKLHGRRTLSLKWAMVKFQESVHGKKDIGYQAGLYGTCTFESLFSVRMIAMKEIL